MTRNPRNPRISSNSLLCVCVCVCVGDEDDEECEIPFYLTPPSPSYGSNQSIGSFSVDLPSKFCSQTLMYANTEFSNGVPGVDPTEPDRQSVRNSKRVSSKRPGFFNFFSFTFQM